MKLVVEWNHAENHGEDHAGSFLRVDVKGILENEIPMGNSSHRSHECTVYNLKNLTFNGTNY
ncbi:hypothetical protein MAR_022544 [Mya arenaria]|uniref:Uncharacterized protein n=1 Tax=Mya arenaria TaxID=6604 RepID=A0ABY7DMJ0_MYAAR|nr:hypothetical protein MAR_022544 [Mya arenaria]